MQHVVVEVCVEKCEMESCVYRALFELRQTSYKYRFFRSFHWQWTSFCCHCLCVCILPLCLAFHGFWFMWVTSIDLCNELCSSGWQLSVCPSILHGKNFNVGHYTQGFEPNTFIPAMFIGTMDFYYLVHFQRIWPWLRVTKRNILASFFFVYILFSWMEWNMVWWWSSSSWKSRDYFWLSYWIKGNNCCFTDSIKNTVTLACIWTFMIWFDSNLVGW